MAINAKPSGDPFCAAASSFIHMYEILLKVSRPPCLLLLHIIIIPWLPYKDCKWDSFSLPSNFAIVENWSQKCNSLILAFKLQSLPCQNAAVKWMISRSTLHTLYFEFTRYSPHPDVAGWGRCETVRSHLFSQRKSLLCKSNQRGTTKLVIF